MQANTLGILRAKIPFVVILIDTWIHRRATGFLYQCVISTYALNPQHSGQAHLIALDGKSIGRQLPLRANKDMEILNSERQFISESAHKVKNTNADDT